MTPYRIETSLLICIADQWISFYMIMTSVIKELSNERSSQIFLQKVFTFRSLISFLIELVFCANGIFRVVVKNNHLRQIKLLIIASDFDKNILRNVSFNFKYYIRRIGYRCLSCRPHLIFCLFSRNLQSLHWSYEFYTSLIKE